MAADWRVGDIVWAKMSKYPYWPAMISEPEKEVKRPSSKKPMHFVYFFGPGNCAWVFDDCIEVFGNNEKYMKCSTASFKAALKDVNDYMDSTKKDKFPKVDESSSKTNGVSPKKKSSHSKDSTPAKKRKSDVSITSKGSTKRRLSEGTSSYTNNSSSDDKFHSLLSNLPSFINDSTDSSYHSNNAWSQEPVAALLKRHILVDDSVEYDLNVSLKSQVVEGRNVQPSKFKIGFLGLGTLGSCIAKNLIHSNHQVTVWNHKPDKCIAFKAVGATVVTTPEDVVANSDVIFSCVSDPAAAKEVVFGNCGVLKRLSDKQGYVEISTLDPDTSRDIAGAITQKGARYLEAPVLGSRELALDGQLVILAAGDSGLFEDCKSCFEAIGEHAFFLGEIGNASKMNVVISMLMGTTLASLAEAMALAKRIELSQQNLLEILELGPLSCPLLISKAKDMIEDKFPPSTPLMHIQKILQMADNLGDQCVQPLPVTGAANQVFKHAKYLGYGHHDMAAVYRSRF